MPMTTCPNCGRSFLDNLLPVHLKGCKPKDKDPPAISTKEPTAALVDLRSVAISRNATPVGERKDKEPVAASTELRSPSIVRNSTPVGRGTSGSSEPAKTEQRLSLLRSESPARSRPAASAAPVAGDAVAASASPGEKSKPQTMTCYICGKEFGKFSLDIHIPQCVKKWEETEAQKPPRERRPVPQKPAEDSGKSEASSANLSTSRSTTLAGTSRSAIPAGRVTSESTEATKTVSVQRPVADTLAKSQPPAPAAPTISKMAAAGEAGDKSLKPLAKSQPPALAVPALSKAAAAGDADDKSLKPLVKSQPPALAAPALGKVAVAGEAGETNTPKTQTMQCYICGKEFGKYSIDIHIPQCAKKWEEAEALKPPRERRPVPQKPTSEPSTSQASPARQRLSFGSVATAADKLAPGGSDAPKPSEPGSSIRSLLASSATNAVQQLAPAQKPSLEPATNIAESKKDVQESATKQGMVNCPNCGRAFLESLLKVHLKSCNPSSGESLSKSSSSISVPTASVAAASASIAASEKTPPLKSSSSASDRLAGGGNAPGSSTSGMYCPPCSSDSGATASKLPTISCETCGRAFTSASTLDIHAPLCAKWAGAKASNAESAPQKPMVDKASKADSASKKPTLDKASANAVMPTPASPVTAGGGGDAGEKSAKQQTTICWICGREFGKFSIDIHIPQCTKKWEEAEAQKPPRERRPVPQKPPEQPVASLKESTSQLSPSLPSTVKLNGSISAPLTTASKTMKETNGAAGSLSVSPATASKTSKEVNGTAGSLSISPATVSKTPKEATGAAGSLSISPTTVSKTPKEANGAAGSLSVSPAMVSKTSKEANEEKTSKSQAIVCYICGKELGKFSIDIHIPQCAKKWEEAEALKPPRERRPVPQKPALESEVVPASPEKLRKPRSADSPAASRPAESPKPQTMTCYICGRDFGIFSIDIHIPQCAQKWEEAEAKKPARERRPVPQKPAPESTTSRQDSAAKVGPPTDRLANSASTRSLSTSRAATKPEGSGLASQKQAVEVSSSSQESSKPRPEAKATRASSTPPAVTATSSGQAVDKESKPRSATCYICGRQFGIVSIDIHIPQCAQKWEEAEAAKPKRDRRPVPQKPVMEPEMTPEAYTPARTSPAISRNATPVPQAKKAAVEKDASGAQSVAFKFEALASKPLSLR